MSEVSPSLSTQTSEESVGRHRREAAEPQGFSLVWERGRLVREARKYWPDELVQGVFALNEQAEKPELRQGIPLRDAWIANFQAGLIGLAGMRLPILPSDLPKDEKERILAGFNSGRLNAQFTLLELLKNLQTQKIAESERAELEAKAAEEQASQQPPGEERIGQYL